MPSRLTYLALMLIGLHSFAFAQSKGSTMSSTAKAAKNMQNPLYPQIQVPITYNYNQNLGANNSVQQGEYYVAPIIPIELTSSMQLIVNPMFTYNRNANDPQLTNQVQPLQLATFFAPVLVGDWYAGIGPYIQTPASNINNGPKQTGMGVSAGVFYTPGNWVIGGAMFNSWGVGSNTSGGTANILNVQPTISYTTDDAWTFNLSSQIVYNYSPQSATNQLTFSGGKTVNVFGYALSLQVGPTYMVTTTPTSAKGFGGYLGITASLPK